jgi:acetyltransferase-like isoleucine patch superfamily enzyme
MKVENIKLGDMVQVDSSSSINNIIIGNHVRVSKRCSLFGAPDHLLEIGDYSYIGMNAIIEGFNEKITIGKHVSLAPNVYIMAGSGPNASDALQKVFPIVKKPVTIGDHCWIGAGAVIMPGVQLGRFCVVGVNSFVNKSFPDFSVIGGSPARMIRELTPAERVLIQSS